MGSPAVELSARPPRVVTVPVRPLASTAALTGASVAISGAALYLLTHVSWRQSILLLIGAAAGIVLYHAAFGFTSSWRALLVERRGAGFRAQLVMLALTCAVFFPVLAVGHAFGQPVRGAVSPVGVSVLVGAFLFGVGMQLGGGCASGTLYTVGGGSTRMLVTLAAFVGGSVLGTMHAPWWSATPALKPTSLVSVLGPAGGLLVTLTVFGTLAALSRVLERRRHGDVAGSIGPPAGGGAMLRGPWPLVAGAVGLAAVNIATLIVSGRPWGVTAAFALWGAKLLAAAGVDVASWPYWTSPAASTALGRSVVYDVTSVMDMGIVFGALAAAGLAGRFAPRWHVPVGPLAAAIMGGLLLGYGARIAYGCNIGAYFSGIASGSLHGWVWLVAALAGNAAGSTLRPFFRLDARRQDG